MRRALIGVMAGALVGVGCGGRSDDVPGQSQNCLQLTLQKDGFSTVMPALVSIFFSVDTCAGEPVADLTADRFTVLEDGKTVSSFESQQQIQPRSQKMRMYSVLLLDLSGSVLRSGDYPKLRAAADAFLDKLFETDGDLHRVAIYAFDGRKDLTPVVGFTSDRNALKAGLDSLEVTECQQTSDCASYADRRTCAGWRCVDDSTNLYGAVVSGVNVVDSALADDAEVALRQGALVVFTDGTDQAARVEETTAVNAVRGASSAVFTVGLGGEIDADVLAALGRDGFYPAANADQLSDAFSQVASRLTSLARRYYLLEYCSPKRNGKHELVIRASLPRDGAEPLTGSLTTEFDATGFESGCSP